MIASPFMFQAAATAVAAVPAEGERELKFAVPGGRVDPVRRWLDAICRRDPRFPAAVVWTIYYDTPDLSALGEKINSEYLKEKIRLRWYSPLAGAPSGPAFIEAKTRVGTRRAKARVRVPFPAEEVASWSLQDPRLQTLPALLRSSSILVHDRWQPLLVLRYRRDRYVEPVSGARVSLDAEIAPVAVNPRFLGGADDRTLEGGVLEIKGALDEMPLALRPLLGLGVRKCSVSKFLAVYLQSARTIL
jgi:hypothetical protein